MLLFFSLFLISCFVMCIDTLGMVLLAILYLYQCNKYGLLYR